MRLNSYVGPIITQMTNTQKRNIYDMSMQNIPNYHVCSLDERESKRINTVKTYCMSMLQTIENKKTLSLMNVLWMRDNQKNSYKCQYERSKICKE